MNLWEYKSKVTVKVMVVLENVAPGFKVGDGVGWTHPKVCFVPQDHCHALILLRLTTYCAAEELTDKTMQEKMLLALGFHGQ